MMNSDDASNSNNNPSNVEATENAAVDAAKAAALKDFTSKIVATIGSEGTQYGCLVSEAMRLFDKDWREGFTSHMSKLGCGEPLELLKKVAMDSNKINVFLDQQNRWRVVIVKNEANKQVLGFIDAEIYRRKNGIKRGRSVNIILLRNQDNYDRLRRGQISFAEAAAVAAANAGIPGGMPGTSASPLPVRRPTYTPSAPRSSSSHTFTPPRPSPSKTPSSSSTNGRSRFANSPPTSARARPNFFRQPSRSPRSPQVPGSHVVQKQPVVKQQQQLASVNYGFQQKSGQYPIHGIGTSTFHQKQYLDLDEPLRTTERIRTPRRTLTPTPRLSTSPPSLPEEELGQGGRLVFDPKTNGFYTRLFSKDHWEQVEAEAKRKIKSEKEQLALPQQQPNSLNSSSGISSLNSSLTNRLAAMDISTDDAVGKKDDDVKEEEKPEKESANAGEDSVPDVPMAAAAADSSVNESLLAPLPDDDDELMEEEDW